MPRERHYEEALDIARTVGDEALEVEILYSLAYVRAIESDYEAANRELEAAAELYERQGNSVMATWATATIGMNMSLAGDHERGDPDARAGHPPVRSARRGLRSAQCHVRAHPAR